MQSIIRSVNLTNDFSFTFENSFSAFLPQAYWGFADHFKDQADVLLSSLEPNYRRVLQVRQIDFDAITFDETLKTGRNEQLQLKQQSQPCGPVWSNFGQGISQVL